jgi:hypothetical protein
VAANVRTTAVSEVFIVMQVSCRAAAIQRA